MWLVFVFVDIETTGLDPDHDLIAEVGYIVTDEQLRVQSTHSQVFPVPAHQWAGAVDHVWEMHTKNGLMDATTAFTTTSSLALADSLVASLREQLTWADVPPAMAGSSVHFDRAFLRQQIPNFVDLFHYRNIDVSSLREAARVWRPELVDGEPTPKKLHRVIPDLEDTIELFRYYKEHLFFRSGGLLSPTVVYKTGDSQPFAAGASHVWTAKKQGDLVVKEI